MLDSVKVVLKYFWYKFFFTAYLIDYQYIFDLLSPNRLIYDLASDLKIMTYLIDVLLYAKTAEVSKLIYKFVLKT